MRRLLTGLIAAAAVAALADSTGPVQVRQDVRFGAPGVWQLVSLNVAPTGTADQVFADWPVNEVGLFDAYSFRRTEQWSLTTSTEGARPPHVLQWRRGDPGASEFGKVLANAVYLVQPTQSCTVSVFGRPEAARITWHPVPDTNTVANYVGLSIDTNRADKVALADYFEGCTAGITATRKVSGIKASGPGEGYVFGELMGTDGEAFAIDAKYVSDWSGVLFVSPQEGLDFGTNGVRGSVSVRNDGATNRLVSIRFRRGDAPDPQGVDAPALRTDAFYWRERSVLGTNWTQFTTAPIVREVATGETWTVEIAFDRVSTADVAAGHVLGGVLEFADASGRSAMRTAIPVSAVADGGVYAATSWPQGLWIAEAYFTYASQVTRKNEIVHEVPAGGTMKARLPLVVKSRSDLTLLQRVSVARDADGALRLFAGGQDLPAGCTLERRISSVVLPTDHPVIPPKPDTTPSFGEEAVFSFRVGKESRINPFYHAQHPLHDGLSADYLEPAPDGDDFANYKGEIKPELFSIGNEVRLTWDETAATVWNPEETVCGTCAWTLSNVVKDGDLQLTGPFVMRRVTTLPVTIPEDGK